MTLQRTPYLMMEKHYHAPTPKYLLCRVVNIAI